MGEGEIEEGEVATTTGGDLKGPGEA